MKIQPLMFALISHNRRRHRAPGRGASRKNSYSPRPLFSSMFPIVCTRKGEPTSAANAWCRDSQKLTTAEEGRPAPRFRTIQVCPKSAARKHAQALALSNAHISPYWQQRAFSGSVKTGPALNGPMTPRLLAWRSPPPQSPAVRSRGRGHTRAASPNA